MSGESQTFRIVKTRNFDYKFNRQIRILSNLINLEKIIIKFKKLQFFRQNFTKIKINYTKFTQIFGVSKHFKIL